MSAKKPIKIWFYLGTADEPGESGHADDLGNGRARICNIPFMCDLNIDDVVKLKKVRGPKSYLPMAGEVIVRAFSSKTMLKYPEPCRENYVKVRDALVAAGCKVEGMVSGILMVAHQDDVKVLKIAKETGVKCSVAK